MIKLEDVTKIYGKHMVVSHVKVVFKKGKITGIIGRNGSGKTVLFRMICGLTKPTSGIVTVDGMEIGKDTDYPPNTGMIIETPGFLAFQSGFQNLMELAAINRRIGKKEVKETMRTVGLDPESRKTVGKYSLGMRQRLGIAQAIMENPDVLVLDEPMNGLDRQGVEDMRNLFQNLKGQGKTILISSHNSEDIRILCDEVYEMDGGKLSRYSADSTDTIYRRTDEILKDF